MKNTFLIALLMVAFAWSCGSEEASNSTSGSSSTNTTKPKAKAIAVDGKAVYQKNCIVCHGVQGDMGASGAFNLKESKLAVEERIAVVTNGRKAMASYKDLLKEEEIEAVAEYTMTLTKN